MKSRRPLLMGFMGSCALSVACAGSSTSQAEQSSLRRKVEALERKVDVLWARDHDPSPDPVLALAGAVLDTDGTPDSAATVVVVAGDRKEEARTDAAGHFTLHAPAGGDALLYAYDKGKSARLRGTFGPAKSVVLNLVAPGAIEGTFVGDASGKVFVWTTPGRVPAVLPGLWSAKPTITGDHFKFDSVPAGDVAVHVALGKFDSSSAAAGHALVHVEPGRTTTLTLDTKPATGAVEGNVVGGADHERIKYEAFLLLPDDSPEAWYPVTGEQFGFIGRTPGERVLLFVARGFKPRRVPVTLAVDQKVNVGDVVLESSSQLP